MTFNDIKEFTYISNQVTVDGETREVITTLDNILDAVQFHKGREYLLEEPLMTKVPFSKYQNILDEWVAAGIPEEPTFEEAKTSKFTQLENSFNQATKNIAKVTPHEMVSWADQEAEASDYIQDNTVITPALSALIEARGLGETVEELANKVLDNALAYRQAYYPLLGKYQKLVKQLEASTTKEEVKAIVW